jgi:hypothetical protein
MGAAKDLQISTFKPGAVWRDGVGSGRFRGDLGLGRGLEVPTVCGLGDRADASDALPCRNAAGHDSQDPVDDARTWPTNRRRTSDVAPAVCDARVPEGNDCA